MILICRKQTLFDVVTALVLVTTFVLGSLPEQSGAMMPVKQNSETTVVIPAPYVTTTEIDKLFEKSGEYCSGVIADKLFRDGIDSTPELKKSGVTGRPFEILKEKVKLRERVQRKASLTKQGSVTTVLVAYKSDPDIAMAKHRAPIKRGRYGLPANAKKYSMAQLDKIIVEVGKQQGCTKTEIAEIKFIMHGEVGRNRNLSIGGDNDHFLTHFQLYYTMCEGKPWWDPYWATKRAIRYMRGHSYKGYGKGIHAAYLNKLNRNWY